MGNSIDEKVPSKDAVDNKLVEGISSIASTTGTAPAAAAPAVTTPLRELLGAGLPEILSSPVVSNYMDYRKLLADFYEYRRAVTKNDLRPYSYSVFSAAANIKSPNYLKMIIDGKRNLSPDMVSKFAKAMNLNREQSDEFRVLVSYNQATDPAERNLFLKELTHQRVESQLKSGEIDQKAFDKVPNWISWIIYAMIDQEGMRFDVDTIRAALRGKASVGEIQDAIESLIRTGEVVRDEATGALKKAHNLIDSPDEIPVALVRKLQTQLMYLGLESLYQNDATQREFGTLTMALTQSEFEQVKFQLRKLRKELHKENAVRRQTTSGERVYQLNIQLFPVSEPVK